MASTTANQDRIRHIAESVDCFTEEELILLADITPNTAQAWRKRGLGPGYILIGNRFLYPRKAVAKYLESITRERTTLGKEALL